ncbi:MAG: trimethylamine methyltransferase family protein [Rhodospirillaceae bacterium]|jgi:trimethylamine---corrinoid protein Co-methyltransferase|nr:trimethylamine methyltransferase family protein [Rhodospirillaceae bacterium]MBT7648502.1 trimethylamine methyltransferase family protein [Rhodospirillaceae bacterium]
MARQRRNRAKKSGERNALNILPWRKISNPYPPIQPLSDDQIEAIHQTSLRVLDELGMKVLDGETRSLLRDAGARVDETSEMVFMDPAMVEERIATTPNRFTIHARNPKKSLEIGGNVINFGPVGGPAFVSDLDRGRRAGTYVELCDFVKLLQMFDIIQIGGAGSFAPLDLPADSRHLDQAFAGLTLTDKVMGSNLLGGERARDGLALIKIAHGITDSDLEQKVYTSGGINTNSPRQVDGNMAQGLLTLTRANQPVIVTPFTLCGAMAPATVAGALAQQNAEALFGLALIQIVQPGAPAVYGGFTSNVDMKSGAPAFGTPEYTLATQATGQLCRRYKVPYRSSSTNASNAPDAQAAYESMMSIWAAVMGYANIVYHGAGWLEGGLVGSFEKLVIDAEMLQMMAVYLEGIRVDEDTLAFDAIKEVQPGGHYFGAQHTIARYEDAFYAPLVSDWRNFETWSDAGAKDTAQRANAIWKRMLTEYEKPAIETDVEEHMRDYITRRKEQIHGRAV